jgi:quercetin dioxygenase-like cupin family protein
MIIRHAGNYQWDDVPVRNYKEQGNTFRSVTRQVLYEGSEGLPFQLRYFEVGAGGHTTLEHHEHEHLVYIERGEGDVLIQDDIHHVQERDVVVIPSHAWHQFQANYDKPLGFLCMVNVERDRPNLPDSEDLERLQSNERVGNFIRS